ncbi:MAG: hypothetical protein M3680_09275 [Myxococcota bacterium]|nr:hypothetical protein [Myxococcota bacterium]
MTRLGVTADDDDAVDDDLAETELLELGATAVPALIEKLADEQYGYRAAMVLFALGAPAARPAIPALARHASKPASHLLHMWAARVLGRLGELDAVVALARNAKTQAACAAGLKAGRPASYPAFGELLAREDAALTKWLIEELRPGSAAYEPASGDFEQIAAAATSPHECIRKDVACALSDFRTGADKARAAPVLASLLGDRSSEVRRLAALNLGYCRGHARGVVGQLRPLLEDRVAAVRTAAKDALAEIEKRRPGT